MMEKEVLLQPDIVGRQKELDILREALDAAAAGNGSTCLVSGEAGIGKTRLVSEILSMAEAGDATVIRGWCLPEFLEPLMPIREALRGCGMEELLAGTRPPKVLSAYLLNDAGMLFARAERTESRMDPDIFAAMLNAVSSFVGDSLKMMGEHGVGAGFSSISHSGYEILVRSMGRLSLAVVVEGVKNEFLIEDMNTVLAEVGENVSPELIDVSGCGWVDERLMKLVTSPRYDGAFVTDDPKLRQENMLDNVLLGLQRISAAGPVVLFLDDLQWADTSTLGMLHYLSRNTRSSRVFMLGTYRPEDVMQKPDRTPHPLETVMQDMSRESLFREIKLGRLGQEGTEGVVKGALGAADFSGEVYKRIHDETEGNPFFVLEVLRLLVNEGFIRTKDGAWAMERQLAELNLPSRILDVVQRRLNRLMKEQYDILECASVVGERFGSDVIGLSMDINRISLLKNLSEIEKIHKLIHARESKYHFDHCKIRDVLYGSISDELRAEYHRAVAVSYEQLFSGREEDIAGELAHHFLMAKDPRAAGHLMVAGDRAVEEYANEEAIRFYTHALDIMKEPGKLEHIKESLGDLYMLVGQYEKSVEMYEGAMELAADNVKRADLHRKTSRVLERHCDYERSMVAAMAGLETLGSTDSPVRNLLRGALSWCHIRLGDYEKALEHQEQSLKDAERLGYMKEIADAHHLTGIIWWFRGSYEKALEHYREALVIQEDIGEERGRMNTLNNIGVMYMETGRLDEALEYFKEGLEYEEMVGDKGGMASTIDNIGNLLHTRGELDKALEYQLRGLELYRMSGDRNGIAWSLSSLGYVYPDMGEFEKGIESFLESAEICKEIGDQHILTYDYYGLADKYAEMGELDKARDYVDRAMELATELGAKREQGTATYVLGIILRNSGQYDEAMKTFDRARAMLADVGDTYLEAAINYDAGLCLKKMGDEEKARELLQRAREHFEKGGMERWLAKVDRALAGPGTG